MECVLSPMSEGLLRPAGSQGYRLSPCLASLALSASLTRPSDSVIRRARPQLLANAPPASKQPERVFTMLFCFHTFVPQPEHSGLFFFLVRRESKSKVDQAYLCVVSPPS